MWFPAVSFGSACIWPFEARPAPFDEIAARANPIPFRSAVGTPATVERVGFQTKIKILTRSCRDTPASRDSQANQPTSVKTNFDRQSLRYKDKVKTRRPSK